MVKRRGLGRWEIGECEMFSRVDVGYGNVAVSSFLVIIRLRAVTSST